MATNVCRKTHEDLFMGATPKQGLHNLCERKCVAKVSQKDFGQAWVNSGKNPYHPQTFACAYAPNNLAQAMYTAHLQIKAHMLRSYCF